MGRRLERECAVLYYKGQDQDDIYLNKTDFALIIMTKFQERQLQKFGPGNICIVSTHGTNGYDIQLYTIMTVDEFGCGCPRCSLFFKSNR